jgi:hypothetical protein
MPVEPALTELARARQIQTGEVRLAMTCSHCGSESVMEQRRYTEQHAHNVIFCLKCGRDTTMVTAHLERRRRIAAYIETSRL